MGLQEHFDAVGDRLLGDDQGVERGRIMNSVGLKTNGRFFAFVRRDELVLKLPAERVTELVQSGAGAAFDAGKGRPMREWVCVTPLDEEACAAYVVEAREFVGSL